MQEIVCSPLVLRALECRLCESVLCFSQVWVLIFQEIVFKLSVIVYQYIT